jgi:hypothetical protein
MMVGFRWSFMGGLLGGDTSISRGVNFRGTGRRCIQDGEIRKHGYLRCGVGLLITDKWMDRLIDGRLLPLWRMELKFSLPIYNNRKRGKKTMLNSIL